MNRKLTSIVEDAEEITVKQAEAETKRKVLTTKYMTNN